MILQKSFKYYDLVEKTFISSIIIILPMLRTAVLLNILVDTMIYLFFCLFYVFFCFLKKDLELFV